MAKYPTLNFCPQCGADLRDREMHGRTRRYCPVCDRVIFRDPKVAAAVIVGEEETVLLVQRRFEPGQGLWSIPAGFVEYDEAPTATAIRECKEETGLDIELTALLDVIPSGFDSGKAAFVVVYEGTVTGGQFQAGDDAEYAAFFSLDNLPPLAFPSTKEALRRWKEKRQFPPKEKRYGYNQ